MRRRWLLTIGCLSVAVVVSLALFVLPSTDHVTLARSDQIHQGMSASDVETILGRPSDETSEEPGVVAFQDMATGGFLAEKYTTCRNWEGANARITVFFRDGVVVRTLAERTMDESWFERLRQTVGLP
jgi:hypothetical protein